MRHACIVLTLCLGACSASSVGGTATHPEPIWAGALLPYSGANAASGANIEQAMLQAVDWVNDHGGIGAGARGPGTPGQPLSLRVRDSQSDATLGLASARDLLGPQHIKYLIGPQEDDLAFAIASDVTQANAVNLLPAVESPSIYNPRNTGIWYTLATPAKYLACGLALYLGSLNVSKIDVISTNGYYDTQLKGGLSSYAGADLITLNSTVTLNRGQPSYSTQLRALGSNNQIVLLTDASTGATVVHDLLTTRKNLKLAMGPSLKTPYFLQNVPVSLLTGQFGVAPALIANAGTDAFSDQYAARWDNAVPLRDAFTYFDAVMLLALALHHAMVTTGTLPDSTTFDTHMRAVTDAKATVSGTWLDYGALYDGIQSGKSVHYVGVTGAFAFDTFHNALPAPIEIWGVNGVGFENNLVLSYCNDTPSAL